jgi:hypothetical protein
MEHSCGTWRCGDGVERGGGDIEARWRWNLPGALMFYQRPFTGGRPGLIINTVYDERASMTVLQDTELRRRLNGNDPLCLSKYAVQRWGLKCRWELRQIGAILRTRF